MKVHLVGGFLGSGKTTAIRNATIKLMNNGIIAGVVTNDQGNYLVDSRFISASSIPTGEVTGGCFCCNYDELDNQIQELIDNQNPQVIFAESVGSCTDLVATVLKPLINFRKSEINIVTLSIFTDSRLLLKYLQNEKLDFSEEVSYIFEKQIEEASILVVNKIDLLTTEYFEQLKKMSKQSFPDKIILFQNSLDINSVSSWLEVIESYRQESVPKTLEIDYQIYGKGEAHLAWLDEEIEINSKTAWSQALLIIESINKQISAQKLNIGHLKYLISSNGKSTKLSFTAIPSKNWKEELPFFEGNKVTLMVNARVETSPENLRKIVLDIVNEANKQPLTQIKEHCISAFQPGFPNPTHRLTT